MLPHSHIHTRSSERMPSNFIVTCWEGLLSKRCVKLWSKVAYYFGFFLRQLTKVRERLFLRIASANPDSHIKRKHTQWCSDVGQRGLLYSLHLERSNIQLFEKSNTHSHRKVKAVALQNPLCLEFSIGLPHKNIPIFPPMQNHIQSWLWKKGFTEHTGKRTCTGWLHHILCFATRQQNHKKSYKTYFVINESNCWIEFHVLKKLIKKTQMDVLKIQTSQVSLRNHKSNATIFSINKYCWNADM